MKHPRTASSDRTLHQLSDPYLYQELLLLLLLQVQQDGLIIFSTGSGKHHNNEPSRSSELIL